jgi:hypothetical protein
MSSATAGSVFKAEMDRGTGSVLPSFQRFGIEQHRLRRIAQRLVDIVACGKTTGKVGKPYPDGLLRPRILNNGYVVRHIQTASIRRPFYGVLEYVMRAGDSL